MCVCTRVFVLWTVTHQVFLSLSACLCHCMTSVGTCLVVTGQQTWKLGQQQSGGRKGKRFRHHRNMRLNHNWFAFVTVELVDHGWYTRWERGRNLGCVSSCVYQKSLMGFFSLSLPPALSWASLEAFWLMIIHTVQSNTNRHARTPIGYDSNRVSSISIRFVLPWCDPSWSSVILL